MRVPPSPPPALPIHPPHVLTSTERGVGTIGEVNEFFQFAGNYWWLVFPVGGIVGGWAGSIARYNEKRRRDKIELARIKATAKAEQMKLTKASRSQIKKTLTAHDELNKRWFDYEVDLATIIDFPLMTDMREPLTQEFHRTKLIADDLRPDNPDDLLDADVYTEYRDAVRAYSLAFAAAEREARRRKQADFNPIERQALEARPQARHGGDGQRRDPGRTAGRLSKGAQRTRRTDRRSAGLDDADRATHRRCPGGWHRGSCPGIVHRVSSPARPSNSRSTPRSTSAS